MADQDENQDQQAEKAEREERERQASAEAEALAKRKRGVEHGIADADKIARTGRKDELVRDTPPAGAWNDVSSD